MSDRLGARFTTIPTVAGGIVRRAGVWQDLAIVAFMSVVAALAALDGTALPALRLAQLPLGLVFVLFIPGYCLTAAIFPRSDDLDAVARVGLSVGSSIAIVAIVAPVLDRLGVGLRLAPIVVSELVLIALFILLATVRRSRLDGPDATGRLPWRSAWASLRAPGRGSLALWVLALPLMAIVAALVALPAPADASGTELYVLGRDNLVGYYPYRVKDGDAVRVTIGVANRTQSTGSYHLEVWLADDQDGAPRTRLLSSAPFSVGPSDALEQPMSWRMMGPGTDRLVEVLLFEGDERQPSRQLRLWMDVEP